MYVRPPNSARERVRVPENYSGSAFSRDPRSDMPPPIRISPGYDLPPGKAEAPPINPIIGPSEEFETREAEADNEQSPSSTIDSDNDAEIATSVIDRHKSSIFGSLIPPIKNLEHSFPFGHGIGSEELLILGMMMLVYLSDSEKGHFDHELMVLLGLLLFAG